LQTGVTPSDTGSSQQQQQSPSVGNDCQFGVSIPDTSFINDIVGSGGNVNACFITKSNIRAWIGGLAAAAALGIGLVGVALLISQTAAAGKVGKAGSAAGSAAELAGAGLALIPGAEPAGLAVAAAGKAAKAPSKHVQQTSQRAVQRRQAARTERRELRERGASDIRTSERRAPGGGTVRTRELSPERRRQLRESQRPRAIATGPNATAADRRRVARDTGQDKPPF
jgi:hypothetical protein